MPPHQGVHILDLRTYDYAVLYGKQEFDYEDLKIGGLSWIIWEVPIESHDSLKSMDF